MFTKSPRETSHGILDSASASADAALKSTQHAATLALDAVRDTSDRVRDKALEASDKTIAYIRNEPVRSVLIAAATGAALIALMRFTTRPNRLR